MEWLFGRKKTPEELLRENQRTLNKAIRELDRERVKMEQQEKKLIADIKKMAKDNQLDSVKIMAKDLVRTRKYIKKFILMKANIQAVSLKVQTLRSQNAMASAMKGKREWCFNSPQLQCSASISLSRDLSIFLCVINYKSLLVIIMSHRCMTHQMIYFF